MSTTTLKPDTKATDTAPSSGLIADANFRWLLAGGVVSLLGDQFTMVALAWLVLQLSGDPLALGVTLALISVPRAVFILVGGAMADRYSPARVLVLSKLAQFVLLCALAAALWAGTLSMWMIHVVALALGLATAFSFPAGSAILPRCLPPALIRPANAWLMSAGQIVSLAGPLLAGVLIAAFGPLEAASDVPDARGLALAFGFDALSFAFSAWAVSRLHVRLLGAKTAVASARQGVLAGIAEASRAFWADLPLRAVCLYFAAIAFFAGGPISVALPVLAKSGLGGDASALGLLLAANGAGVLVGMTLSGVRPSWRLGTLGTTMLVVDALAGLGFAALGLVHTLWPAMALLAVLGLLMGFVRVAVFSWLQRRVPPAMLGRTMSLFMFIVMGLTPLSSALAGASLRLLSPGALFAASGLALVLIVIAGAVMTPIRHVSEATA